MTNTAGGTSAGSSHAERTFALWALLVFALVVMVLARLHEPWHDELQAWRIAIDSPTLSAMHDNLRYEGHPMLFYLVLRVVGMLSRSWTAAVAMHVAIACGTAWIVLRHAPFTRVQRLLIVFGYFFLYEYAVIVRSYGLGVLLVLGTCAAWCAPRRRIWTSVVLLVLLANVSAIGLVLAIAMAIALTFDYVRTGDTRWWIRRRSYVVAAAVAAVTVGITLQLAAAMKPPSNARYQGTGLLQAESRLSFVGASLSVPASVIVPLAQTGNDHGLIWGSWLFAPTSRLGITIVDAASLIVVLIGVLLSLRRQVSLVLWLSALAGLMVFFMFIHQGGVRHHGAIVIALIASAWLANARTEPKYGGALQRWIARTERYRGPVFTALLIPMVCASLQFGAADARSTFSDGEATAQLLQRDSLTDLPIVGLAYPWSQPVAALLGRPVYYVVEGRSGTFVNAGRVNYDTLPAVRADRAVRSLLTTQCRVVVISSERREPSAWLKSQASRLRGDSSMSMSGDKLRTWLVRAPVSVACPAPMVVAQ
jgi:hypothetical protein